MTTSTQPGEEPRTIRTNGASSPTVRPQAAPRESGHWLLGSLARYREEGLEFYAEVQARHGDVVEIRFGPSPILTVFHPEGIRHVLRDNHRNYQREPFTNGLFLKLTGDNLFTSDGEDWLARRRRLQPAFHRRRIAGFADAMVARTEDFVDRWLGRAHDGALDMAAEMRALTMVIVGEALFGVDFEGEARDLARAFITSTDYFAWRTQHFVAPPLAVPTRRNRALRSARIRIQGRMQAMLDERRAAGETGDDFMGMLMELRDPDTDEAMPDAVLRAELGVMFGAGHETTAAALAWALWLLAEHPAAEAELRAELAEVLGTRSATVDDLPALRRTRAVVDEAMRLYPPAWAISRQAIGEDVVLGVRVKAGQSLTLLPYFAHRDPRYWDAPAAFDPERWLDGRAEEADHAGAYLPFGAGPRKCIGQTFALTEATLVLATMLQRTRMSLAPGFTMVPDNGFSLRPHDGLPMHVDAAG